MMSDGDFEQGGQTYSDHPVLQEYRNILDDAGHSDVDIDNNISPEEFYQMTKNSQVVVATGEPWFFGNLILTAGVIDRLREEAPVGPKKDCVPKEWKEWGSCSKTCTVSGGNEGAYRERTREEESPKENGGAPCVVFERQPCIIGEYYNRCPCGYNRDMNKICPGGPCKAGQQNKPEYQRWCDEVVSKVPGVDYKYANEGCNLCNP